MKGVYVTSSYIQCETRRCQYHVPIIRSFYNHIAIDHATSRKSAPYSTNSQSNLLKLPQEIILQMVQGYLEHEGPRDFRRLLQRRPLHRQSHFVLPSCLEEKVQYARCWRSREFRLTPPSSHSPHLTSLIADVLHGKDISHYARRLIFGPTDDWDDTS